MRVGFGILLGLLAASVVAQEPGPRNAVVKEIEGTVDADVGQGLLPAQVEQRLPPASRVLVAEKSHTILSYGKDCDIRLEPGDWRVPNPSAATLTEVEGSVQIYNDVEFVPVVPNQPVKVNDRILVQQDSSAVLRYETGCDVKLDPGMHDVEDGCKCLAALAWGTRPAIAPWAGCALMVGGAAAVCDCGRPISP